MASHDGEVYLQGALLSRRLRGITCTTYIEMPSQPSWMQSSTRPTSLHRGTSRPASTRDTAESAWSDTAESQLRGRSWPRFEQQHVRFRDRHADAGIQPHALMKRNSPGSAERAASYIGARICRKLLQQRPFAPEREALVVSARCVMQIP